MLAPGVGGAATDLDAGRAALEKGEERFDRLALEAALKHFQKVAQVDGAPALLPYWQARASLALVSWHQLHHAADRALHYVDRAVESGRQAVEANPLHSDSHRVLGEALGRLIGLRGWTAGALHGRRAQNALALAVRLDPQNVKALVATGVSKLRTPKLFGGDADAAVRAFEKARVLDPHAWEPHAWLGIAAKERGDAAAALTFFLHALMLNPYNEWVRSEIALLGWRR